MNEFFGMPAQYRAATQDLVGELRPPLRDRAAVASSDGTAGLSSRIYEPVRGTDALFTVAPAATQFPRCSRACARTRVSGLSNAASAAVSYHLLPKRRQQLWKRAATRRVPWPIVPPTGPAHRVRCRSRRRCGPWARSQRPRSRSGQARTTRRNRRRPGRASQDSGLPA